MLGGPWPGEQGRGSDVDPLIPLAGTLVFVQLYVLVLTNVPRALVTRPSVTATHLHVIVAVMGVGAGTAGPRGACPGQPRP